MIKQWLKAKVWGIPAPIIVVAIIAVLGLIHLSMQ